MALNNAEAMFAVSGEISVGDLAATFPATSAAALTGFTGTGYISEDGVEENIEVTRSTIKGWQNAATIRERITEAKASWSGTLLQRNKFNTELVYGTTVTQTSTEGSYTVSPGKTSGRKKFVMDIIDGTDKERTTFEGELFLGDDAVTYDSESPIGYPFVIVAYTDFDRKSTKLKSA